MIYYVYGLIDPEIHRVCYIGKTENFNGRFGAHLADESDSAKSEWIRSLGRRELEPIAVLLEECHSRIDAEIAERWWILQGDRMKWPLTNSVISRLKINPDEHRSKRRSRFRDMERRHEEIGTMVSRSRGLNPEFPLGQIRRLTAKEADVVNELCRHVELRNGGDLSLKRLTRAVFGSEHAENSSAHWELQNVRR